jgi:hypothetical protein
MTSTTNRSIIKHSYYAMTVIEKDGKFFEAYQCSLVLKRLLEAMNPKGGKINTIPLTWPDDYEHRSYRTRSDAIEYTWSQ